jgi:carbohydrate-selective porin OprB
MLLRATVVVCACASLARADEFATSPARPGYMESGHLLWWDGRQAAEDAGLNVDGTYATDMFLGPQLDDAATLAGLFTLEVDLDLSRLARRGLGTMHVSSFAIHGKSPTDELMDLHGVSGNAASPDVRLFEAWYEQPIGPLSIRAGLIAADQEFVYADPADTLLAATFGITTQFSFNAIGPVYPIASPGVSTRVETDHYLLQLAVYDGAQQNTHGVPTALGPGYLVIGEATLDRALGIGGWHHSDRADGMYVTLDHQLEEQVAAFTRAGYSPNGPVPVYLDAGLRLRPGPLRPDDFFCVGIAYATSETGGETLVETSYEAQLDWLTIQPDFQLLFLRERTVAIGVVRTTVAF